MVLHRNSLLWKHAPEQMSWLAAERPMFCTTICEKRLHSNYVQNGVSQPIKWEIFCVLPIAFPLLMWRFELMRCSVIHSAMGDRKVPRTEEVDAALHMLGALCWSYNAQKHFCIHILLPKILVRIFCCWRDSHPEARFSMSIWNENGSRLARKWRIWARIELNATIGQLVKMRTPIGCGMTNPWVNTTQKVPQQTFAVAADLMSASLSHLHSHNTRIFSTSLFHFCCCHFSLQQIFFLSEQNSGMKCSQVEEILPKAEWLAGLESVTRIPRPAPGKCTQKRQ